MQAIMRIDSWLEAKIFQRLVDLSGMRPKTLRQHATLAYAVITIIRAMIDGVGPNWFYLETGLLAVLLMSLSFFLPERPAEPLMALIRVMQAFLVMTATTSLLIYQRGHLLTIASGVAVTVFLYMLSCRPPPPRRGVTRPAAKLAGGEA